MNELQIIDRREVLGKQFTVYGTIDNPLFLAKDVAEWIDYAQTSNGVYNVSAMLGTIDEGEKLISKIFISGQNRDMWLLTEDGLYEVLFQSHKPIAKQFKKEVKEILRTIRKHGAYMTAQKIEEVLLNPDTIIQLATSLKSEREQRRKLELQNAQKEQIINELKPKADYTDFVLKNKSLVTTTQIAKDYGMSGQEMNSRLHRLKVQFKQSGQWLLYKKYQKSGYTHSETIDIEHRDGRKDVTMHTKWTQKGRLFIYNLMKKQGILPLIERKEGAAQ